MTISTTANRASYVGNGVTTVFPFAPPFVANSDLVVTETIGAGTPTLLVLNVDYTVTGAGSSSGGTVTRLVATANGTVLLIVRAVPFTQGSAWPNGTAFDGPTVEAAFDRAVMLIDQISDRLDQAVLGTISANASAIANSPAGNIASINVQNALNELDGEKANALTSPQSCDGRLTLTTLVPVTTADVAAAVTIFYTPFRGNKIQLYSGTAWVPLSFSEVSIAVPATTSQMYDVFAFSNAGVLTLELLAWTNDTTRATALVLQDGVLCKTGALTRRYLGSFRTTTVAGQTEDSKANRFLWNCYNRARRSMIRQDATVSWTYSTATFRQANASTANQLNYVQGLAEDDVEATVGAQVGNSAVTARTLVVGIGIDSTTVDSSLICLPANTIDTSNHPLTALWRGVPGVGKHSLMWLEKGAGADTQTWSGTGANTQTGFIGSVLG